MIYIKHEVYGVPSGRSSDQIEKYGEYYRWRIFIDGDVETLETIQKVEYIPNDPSFYGQKVTRSDWRNRFEYSIFGYGSIFITYIIYIRNRSNLPISGKYYLDISKSNLKGEPITVGY